ncbi:MAG: Mrp/NBP35 family ATP-binding protein [Firmicutes bacterium]|nr:Mrp/NBP35 family ATP-binding protein [Bacillota bacterium]
MSENCESSCGSCGESCDSRKEPQDLKKQPHPKSKIGKVIGVVSGKGGVGKSLVTSLMAIEMNRRGFKTAILDADITGPSIPKSFGVTGPITTSEEGVIPATSKTGIDLISINLFLENENDPVLWRGPIVTGTVTQFWQEVIWKDIDYMFIDMPPGTGDVSLTIFQSIKIDGIIIVTSPQELVSMIVSKAVKMAQMMNIPIIGLVENMSYFKCPDNGKDYKIFGDSHIDDIAKEYDLDIIGKIPIDPLLAENIGSGTIEDYPIDNLKEAADMVVAI